MALDVRLADAIVASGRRVSLNSGRLPKLTLAAAAFLFVGALGMLTYMFPGQATKCFAEPRYVPATVVACWRFETFAALTPRQRLLWRYRIRLERNRGDLQIVFDPRDHVITDERSDKPSVATYVLVDPRTMSVRRVRLYVD